MQNARETGQKSNFAAQGLDSPPARGFRLCFTVVWESNLPCVVVTFSGARSARWRTTPRALSCFPVECPHRRPSSHWRRSMRSLRTSTLRATPPRGSQRHLSLSMRSRCTSATAQLAAAAFHASGPAASLTLSPRRRAPSSSMGAPTTTATSTTRCGSLSRRRPPAPILLWAPRSWPSAAPRSPTVPSSVAWSRPRTAAISILLRATPSSYKTSCAWSTAPTWATARRRTISCRFCATRRRLASTTSIQASQSARSSHIKPLAAAAAAIAMTCCQFACPTRSSSSFAALSSRLRVVTCVSRRARSTQKSFALRALAAPRAAPAV
eukprot:m.6957 g.6957  ORF g.6957 m.6957 type:complete len:324 (+) comp2686_c0_seq1:678-1649(+)